VFDVGSLVTISKGVLDTFGSLRKLLEQKSPDAATVAAAELTERIDHFQARLEGIAIQLQQAERLTRMIPAWEAYANQISTWKDVPTVPDADAQQIHVALSQLIDSSIRDQFSGTFFRTDFDDLPDMRRLIDIFRAHITNLDRTISGIPAGNLHAFRALWPSISTEFNNLKNSSYEVRRRAEDIQGDLIAELLKSSQEARKFLAQAPK
jgi:hypothetical protein